MKNKPQTLPTTTKDSTIEITFKLSLVDGTIVDETQTDELLKLTIGDGQFIKSLEDLFIGLEQGTTANFKLSPAEAFGVRDPDNIQSMKKSDFAEDMKIAKGSVVSFDSPTGQEVLGTVHDFVEDNVLVDFNHPLADRELIFEFTIRTLI